MENDELQKMMNKYDSEIIIETHFNDTNYGVSIVGDYKGLKYSSKLSSGYVLSINSQEVGSEDILKYTIESLYNMIKESKHYQRIKKIENLLKE